MTSRARLVAASRERLALWLPDALSSRVKEPTRPIATITAATRHSIRVKPASSARRVVRRARTTLESGADGPNSGKVDELPRRGNMARRRCGASGLGEPPPLKVDAQVQTERRTASGEALGRA